MVGQPELRTQDQEPTLILGGLEFGAPRQLDPAMTTYIPRGVWEALNGLLTDRETSGTYDVFKSEGTLTWGVRETAGPAVSLGVVGFSDFPEEDNLLHAESWIYFFDSEMQGRGSATRAYQHMVCAGLAMGLDVIHAEVRSDNQRSVRLHERCGFVTVHSSEELGQPYRNLHLCLFNPRLGQAAVDLAVNGVMMRGRSPGFDPADVKQSLRRVSAMQDRLDYVRQAVSAQRGWEPFIARINPGPTR